MEHVMSYFNAELGVPCSLDPEGKLTFKVWGLKLATSIRGLKLLV